LGTTGNTAPAAATVDCTTFSTAERIAERSGNYRVGTDYFATDSDRIVNGQ
jgi:hypothetical protein